MFYCSKHKPTYSPSKVFDEKDYLNKNTGLSAASNGKYLTGKFIFIFASLLNIGY